MQYYYYLSENENVHWERIKLRHNLAERDRVMTIYRLMPDRLFGGDIPTLISHRWADRTISILEGT